MNQSLQLVATTHAEDEAVIERGLPTCVEVIGALLRIREGKKYEGAEDLRCLFPGPPAGDGTAREPPDG